MWSCGPRPRSRRAGRAGRRQTDERKPVAGSLLRPSRRSRASPRRTGTCTGVRADASTRPPARRSAAVGPPTHRRRTGRSTRPCLDVPRGRPAVTARTRSRSTPARRAVRPKVGRTDPRSTSPDGQRRLHDLGHRRVRRRRTTWRGATLALFDTADRAGGAGQAGVFDSISRQGRRGRRCRRSCARAIAAGAARRASRRSRARRWPTSSPRRCREGSGSSAPPCWCSRSSPCSWARSSSSTPSRSSWRSARGRLALLRAARREPTAGARLGDRGGVRRSGSSLPRSGSSWASGIALGLKALLKAFGIDLPEHGDCSSSRARSGSR